MTEEFDVTVIGRTTLTTERGRLHVEHARAGRPDRPALVLLHGFPHTWRIWTPVLDALADTHHVLAPDLRGLGGSSGDDAHDDAHDDAFDAGTLARDVVALLDHHGIRRATLVALDLGTRVAVRFALDHPDRLDRLVVSEAVLAGVPGAESFHTARPWWFGFHAVPGLVETVVPGSEAAYLDFFLDNGTRHLPADIRAEIVRAYTGPAVWSRVGAHYRAATADGDSFAAALAAGRRITSPTLALAAAPVGDLLHRQLTHLCDDLTGRVLTDCRHIAPLDRPADVVTALREFLPLLRRESAGSPRRNPPSPTPAAPAHP